TPHLALDRSGGDGHARRSRGSAEAPRGNPRRRGQGGPLNVPIKVERHSADRAGSARRRDSITVGVPFPRAACREPQNLRLIDDANRSFPLQAKVLDRWDDGSIRWVLI